MFIVIILFSCQSTSNVCEDSVQCKTAFEILSKIEKMEQEDPAADEFREIWLLGDEAYPAIIYFLKNSKHRGVRVGIIDLLKESKKHRFFLDLLTCALDDPDSYVRIRAIGSIFYVDKENALPHLLTLATDLAEDPYVRSSAVTGLGNYPATEVGEPLIGLLTDSSPIVRRDAVWAIFFSFDYEKASLIIKESIETEKNRDVLTAMKNVQDILEKKANSKQ